MNLCRRGFLTFALVAICSLPAFARNFPAQDLARRTIERRAVEALNSVNHSTVTFAKAGTPPVNGFWSLSIYNEHHFFINAINRFSIGTKNKDLKLAADGSLTIYVQAEIPTDPIERANRLPAPKGDFSLYVRACWPKPAVIDGSWTPAAVRRTN